MRLSKRWAFPLAIIVLLIGIRLALPYFVLRYVNKVLNDIPGYRGSVEDVDLHLWRGAYGIDSLKLDEIKGEVPVPFLLIKKIDLSIQWNALFEGAIVGEVDMLRPEIIFAAGPAKGTGQTGEETDWTKPLKELMPLTINRFQVNNGKISYLDLYSDPKVDIYIEHLQLVAYNLNNVEDKNNALPSTLTATGTSIGGGKLMVDLKMNALKKIPDLDLNLEFTDVTLKSLNSFIKAYAKIDVESGSFDMFSEIVLNDGNFDGYVKPVIRNIKILNLEEDNKDKENVFQLLWEGIAGLFGEAFENQSKDQIATRVPIEGRVDNVQTNVWKTIFNVFKNAFIEAFQKEIDHSVKYNKDNKDKD